MSALTRQGRQPVEVSGRFVLAGLGFVAVYLALDWVSFIHPFLPVGFTPWNPQAGLCIAFVVRGRPPNAVWLPPAALVADLVVRGVPASPAVALVSALVLGGGYAATALLLRRLRGFDARLSTVSAVVVLVAVALASSGVVSALNAGIFAAAGLLSWGEFLEAAFRHWVGDLIGILVVTPLALRASRIWFDGLGRRIGDRGVEFTGQVASILLAVWLVFGLEDTDEFKFFYLLFLPVIWMSLRHGLDGATLALALTQVGIIVAIESRRFNAGIVTEFQILMMALACTGLLIGAVVTDRRRVQALLRESEARLRERHGELAQFARTSAVGEVASTLAHELSQPLSATSTYIGACRRLLAAPLADIARIREAMVKAEVQAQRAGRVLAGLRDFLYRGETHLAPESVADILDSLRGLTQAEFERTDATLVIDDRSAGAAALVDRIQIEQALLNLVRNALEAIGEAGASERRVTMEARFAAGIVEIDVVDSGPGVPAEIVPDLFHPFATTKARGMGLGLTISRSIVEAHGGRLWYEPHPGNGSIFRMTLPTVEIDAR